MSTITVPVTITLPDPPGFAYNMGYNDPPGFARTIAPNSGSNTGLTIAPGLYPPGYHISDGVTIGGVFPASGATQTGVLPIRIQPPPTGTGPMKFSVMGKATITNLDQSREIGFYTIGFGVVNVNGPNQPIFPWLGVGHDLDVTQQTAISIGPSVTQNEIFFRLDVLDPNLSSVPGFPNWQVTPDPATLLYPAISPIFFNRGPTSLQVSNVFIVGHAL